LVYQSSRFKKELWTLRAEERERKGRCFAGMLMDTAYDPSNGSTDCGLLPQADINEEGGTTNCVAAENNEKIHRKTYRFKRSPAHGRTTQSLVRHILPPNSNIFQTGIPGSVFFISECNMPGS
jgi:hypothetical protein